MFELLRLLGCYILLTYPLQICLLAGIIMLVIEKVKATR